MDHFNENQHLPHNVNPANTRPIAPVEPATSVMDDPMDFIAGDRDLASYNKAARHSSIVRVLRIVLPLVAVFLLAVLFGAYFWSQSSLPKVTITATEVENGKMVMKNPELNGVDGKQRPYNLSAREAIQDPNTPSVVELLDIDANVPMEKGLFAHILAGTGFYDSEAKTLKLGGEVDVKTNDGMSMRLQDADVDIDAGNLDTNNPVSMFTEQAEISAERLSVQNNGEIVVFENRVKMTIYPDKIENAENANNGNTQ